MMMTIVGIMVVIIIIFNFIGGSTTTITDSAYAVTAPNNCSLRADSTGASDVYNRSNSVCINSTLDKISTARIDALPLASMFGASGVLLLLLMVGVLVAVVIMVWKHMKDK